MDRSMIVRRGFLVVFALTALLAGLPADAAAPEQASAVAGQATPSLPGAAQATPAVLPFNPDTRPPDINSVPVLANIVKSGSKLYYMGERSGIFGWFIVKNGEIQMIYVSNDLKTALIGAMFTAQGENVSGVQVGKLAEKDKDIYELLNGAAQQKGDILQATLQNTPPMEAPNGVSIPGITVSPGERLYQDMKAAAGVDLGKETAPEIMMIVAPKCPNCKRTWMELREAVKAGQVKVRLVPVYNSTGSEEVNMSAQLLRAKDPLDAWDRLANGDAQALAGTPDETAVHAVMANLGLVSKWNIKGYPYLVYRGNDGRVKIVQGKPDRMAAVLVDVTR